MKYHYFAIFDFENEGYNVRFPDLDGAFTCGETYTEAMLMAKDLLEGYLLISEIDNENIPRASSYIELFSNIKKSECLKLIYANTCTIEYVF